MSTTAFTQELKVTSTKNGVTITKAGESWGDPWPVHDTVLEVSDVAGLIKALQAVQSEQSYERW